MNISKIKKIIPNNIKYFLKKRTIRSRLHDSVINILPNVLCIDVGASYYPHTRWDIFLNSNKTTWIAVEPNESNLNYICTWKYAAVAKAVNFGLSQDGGNQTLYITNVDSGSSLLKPEITSGMKHRINKIEESYYFPYKRKSILTKKLSDIINDESNNFPIFVKLDTQGTELSILKGAVDYLNSRRIIGLELESTLLAMPIMQEAGKFSDVCNFLESFGFELLDMKIIRAASLYQNKKAKGKQYINECDAVFALRRDIVATLDLEYRIALFGFYVTNEFYEEAYMLIRDDEILRIKIDSSQSNSEKIMNFLLKKA